MLIVLVSGGRIDFMEFFKSVFRPIWNSPTLFKFRGIVFNTLDFISGYYFEKRKFKKMMGYDLCLNKPKSFSHHIIYNKIYDRRDVLSIVADKYAVRKYLIDTLGQKEAESILIPLLYSGTNPENIPFDKLEGEYIVKANHNSGPHFIIKKGDIPNKKLIISELKKQLSIPYGILKHEWAYGRIKERRVVVERLLRDESGSIPKDYKFHMIEGECAFVQIDFDRFTSHSRTLYDKDWTYIPVTLKFKQGVEASKPVNFEKMLSLSRQLSKGFSYIRIDLYSIGDRVFFGEMTHYPGSGMERFTPESFDFKLGNLWNVKND